MQGVQRLASWRADHAESNWHPLSSPHFEVHLCLPAEGGGQARAALAQAEMGRQREPTA